MNSVIDYTSDVEMENGHNNITNGTKRRENYWHIFYTFL